ncbi:uncharacterized protein LOC142163922 [Nicotiana tabacum]|uniref:Uncharacterized protein LOC142163922 n=1 Tax=Nicotiana tabacum TaxID=4097 RepID=A0AC58RWP8_TOBAC
MDAGFDNSADPQCFLDGTLKALRALGCSSERAMKLVAYKLEDMANTWYGTILLGRPAGAAPLTWDEFSTTGTENRDRGAGDRATVNQGQGNAGRVATPVGESLLAEYVYRACKIQVEDIDTLADLIVLDMIDFDKLMGMDCLSSCYAIVDFHAKIVKFEIPNEPYFILRGSQVREICKVVSFMKAQRLMKKGSLGFLAIVNDTRKETISIENVPVMREFSDVFPKDLPGLPPQRDLNLRQLQWMELLKDYDCSILYHPRKANVVADELSRKSIGSLAHIVPARRPLVEDMHRLEGTSVRFSVKNLEALLACVQAKSSLVERIKATQYEDERFCKYRDEALAGKSKDMIVESDGVLQMGDRLCVADVDGLRHAILIEAHNSRYTIHPESTKMSRHQRPAGLLQQIEILEWTWERITMDFVTGLPHTLRGYDSVWVIVDRLTKSAHFLPAKTTYGGVRQKSYADKSRRDLVFTIEDKVFLRVSPMKGVIRFGKRGKLSLRFIGPYEILDRVRAVAYRLALPPELSFIHPVFHVSMLRKCISDSSQMLEAPTIPLDEKLSYEEEPMAIANRQVRKLRSKEIEFVKVLWRNHTVEEAT